MSSSPFYMVQLQLRQEAVISNARRDGIPLHELDDGYGIHCLLHHLFGNHAPRPFHRVGSSRGGISILGYSSLDDQALLEIAQSFALPHSFKSCDWSTLASKPMPRDWPRGRQYRFEVRSCPVIRKASAGPYHCDGAELDAFLDSCWHAGDPAIPVDRETVYREWLRAQMERSGAVRLREAELLAFKRSRLMRRTQGSNRKALAVERPDALLAGQLEVIDSCKFNEWLRRGIGRHRAFGFGMVLLKPIEA